MQINNFIYTPKPELSCKYTSYYIYMIIVTETEYFPHVRNIVMR